MIPDPLHPRVEADAWEPRRIIAKAGLIALVGGLLWVPIILFALSLGGRS